MNKPEISVVMSVYNSDKYLSAAIDSILNQTFKNFEFIIFDDGSTDKSREIIEKYSIQDERIVKMFNKNNIGAVGFIRNLNKGIKISKGNFIARMDSDDISSIDRLKIQYDYMLSHPDVFLCASGFQCIDEDDNFLSTVSKYYSSTKVKLILPKKNIIHHPTVMFRNNGIIEYREKALFCEDNDLWLRFLSDDKLMIVMKDVLLKYRIHKNSETSLNARKQQLFIKQVQKWYIERVKYKKDSYDIFNVNEILDSIKVQNSLSVRELKFLYIANDIKKFRKELFIFYKENGLSTWIKGLVFYILSFLPRKIQKLSVLVFWK